MLRKTLFVILPVVIGLPAHAEGPLRQAPASVYAGKETIQCPQHLAGWPHEVIDVYDCNIPGVNTKSLCQKWNSHQISTPAGWDYEGVKRYGSINHIVSSHYMATVANKTYLYCAYSTNRGTPNITTYIIRRQAPGGMNCQKAGNYAFSCRSRAMERLQQYRR